MLHPDSICILLSVRLLDALFSVFTSTGTLLGDVFSSTATNFVAFLFFFYNHPVLALKTASAIGTRLLYSLSHSIRHRTLPFTFVADIHVCQHTYIIGAFLLVHALGIYAILSSRASAEKFRRLAHERECRLAFEASRSDDLEFRTDHLERETALQSVQIRRHVRVQKRLKRRQKRDHVRALHQL